MLVVERGRCDRSPIDTAVGTAFTVDVHGAKVIRQPIGTSRQVGSVDRLRFRRRGRALLPPRPFGSLIISESCDAYGRDVHITGSIGDPRSFPTSSSGGVTLGLIDDSERFLCFDYMERLSDDREPATKNMAAL